MAEICRILSEFGVLKSILKIRAWLFGSRYLKMDQVKFVEDSIWKVWSDDHFKFFKGCLPQILLGPFLNTLTHLAKAITWVAFYYSALAETSLMLYGVNLVICLTWLILVALWM